MDRPEKQQPTDDVYKMKYKALKYAIKTAQLNGGFPLNVPIERGDGNTTSNNKPKQ